MIKNDQSSSAVYGLFDSVEFEGNILLGIYFLEGEAEAARAAYIDNEVSEYPQSMQARERNYREKSVVVKRLQAGLKPSVNFAD